MFLACVCLLAAAATETSQEEQCRTEWDTIRVSKRVAMKFCDGHEDSDSDDKNNFMHAREFPNMTMQKVLAALQRIEEKLDKQLKTSLNKAIANTGLPPLLEPVL